jgi:hypothetical protein
VAEREELTPEQLLEEIRRIKVTDFLESAVATLGQLAYSKLDASVRDLEQARLAIEAAKALLPTLEGELPAQTMADYNQLVANLQLAYVAASTEAPAPDPEEREPAEEPGPAPEGDADS